MGKAGTRFRFCSPVCHKRAYRRYYRALNGKRGPSKVRMADLWARDRGRCQLCGKECSPLVGSHWTDPHAATRDHVVPISKGGADTLGNCQLAHRSCNSAKGTKVRRQQRLFG